jgi:hypothetical protein
LHTENNNNKNLHSLVIDVVDDLFLVKTATITVAIILARRIAVSIDKIEHKGEHKQQ